MILALKYSDSFQYYHIYIIYPEAVNFNSKYCPKTLQILLIILIEKIACAKIRRLFGDFI